ncbi:MAG: hypothetical protein JWM87_2453 [Candidatus Eremiobacteraeota bacterium]|nr:hypothetical protein [Candidatus Eremiobacteraeota bacterium]
MILAGAAAELRERLRDRSTYVALFVSLVGIGLLFPSDGSGYATIAATGKRVLLSSSASAALAAVLLNAFFSVVGLLAVSATLLRDTRPSGIGESLRTSPASNFALLAGRWLANLALLAGFGAVACVLAIVMVWPRVANFDPVSFVAVYALLVVPALVILAGAGLVFDVVFRGSRAWRVTAAIVLWLIAISVAAIPGAQIVDPLGIGQFEAQLAAAGHGVPVSFGIAPMSANAPVAFSLDFPITWGLVAGRIAAALAGVAIALLALVRFPRFAALPVRADDEPLHVDDRPRSAATPLSPVRLARMPLLVSRAAAEVRMMRLGGVPWAVLSLAVLGNVLGFVHATTFALALLTLVPVVLSQRIVLTETPLGTESLIGTLCAAERQYVLWKVLALGAASLALALPYLVYAAAADPLHALGLVAADLAIVTLTVAIGYVSGSVMPGLLAAGLWWYLFSFNTLPPAIDVAGVHAAPSAVAIAAYVVAALAVLAAACTGRRGAALASS